MAFSLLPETKNKVPRPEQAVSLKISFNPPLQEVTISHFDAGLLKKLLA